MNELNGKQKSHFDVTKRKTSRHVFVHVVGYLTLTHYFLDCINPFINNFVIITTFH
jgi:hypothetical protein